MKEYSNFEELTEAASQYLRDRGRSKQTIWIYNWIWRKIKVFMDDRNLKYPDAQTVATYLIETYDDHQVSTLSHHHKHCYRCALCLAQFSETNKMIDLLNHREKAVLTGEFGMLINQYAKHKKSLGLGDKTLHSYSWYLYKFQNYIYENGIHAPEALSPLLLVNYMSVLLPDAFGARHLALSIIRNFLKYLYDTGRTGKDLSLVIPRDNYKNRAKLPSVYTKEEVSIILDSIDRSTVGGKKDYAINPSPANSILLSFLIRLIQSC